jgi:hypothetical protein
MTERETNPKTIMPGLGPGIHAFFSEAKSSRMAASHANARGARRAAMTA